MSITNETARQELNNNQNKNRRAETNEAINEIELILLYSEKQGKNLIGKMKKHIREALPEQVQMIMKDQKREWSRKFNVKFKTEFCH